MPPRSIVHLDADAFFAAVEQAADPKLRGKPIAVGGEKRGIIASASYEARKFGVYTPMPTARARKLCPKLIVLPGDFERYEQFSHWMFGYCYDFTPEVEQTSIDEGYFDLSGTRKPAAEIALTIRKAIGQRLKITVSEGIGTNKLVSAVASKLGKPRAFHEVPPGQESAFLHPLPNKWLPGVGPKTSVRLNSAGLAECRHVAITPLSMLELVLGNQASTIRRYANGIDERPLVPMREPQKSFGHQETFATDLTDEEYAEAVLRRMADNLFATVREESRSIRTLTVKVRYNDMGEDQVSESLLEPTDLETDIYGLLHTLLRKAWKRRVSLRLVSLKLSNLYHGPILTELPILPSSQRHDSNARLAAQIDALRKTHGHAIILRGHDFRLRAPPANAICTVLPRLLSPLRSSLLPKRRELANYVPLRAHSHYSFLDSTLSPARIVELAKLHGLRSAALSDTGNLHGAVEFVLAAKEAGVKPIIGTELRVADKTLLLYVESASGYPHPSLEVCLRSTYGLVVYEEHILQICEAFAGLPPGRADVLRRALNKQKRPVIEEIQGEFFSSAFARGHSPEKTAEVWGLVTGFAGYAFCKAHSTAYGVEAYQSAWLKRYFPAEFMSAVLSNGKGFYNPLVYVLECHRLGLKLLPPSVN